MEKAERRQFLVASSALLAAPLTSFAQPAGKVRRIGYLGLSAPAQGAKRRLQDSLKRVGYEEGRNLIIESRFAEGKVERLPALAEELAGLNVELINNKPRPGELPPAEAAE